MPTDRGQLLFQRFFRHYFEYVSARRHGQEGALALLWKCCEVFLCISSYSKTLSGRIIYTLFFTTSRQLLWGLCPQDPSLDASG